VAAPEETLIWIIFPLVAGASALFVGYLAFDWIRARAFGASPITDSADPRSSLPGSHPGAGAPGRAELLF
jgi:hypothetical protein